jgi:hypothetical protein
MVMRGKSRDLYDKHFAEQGFERIDLFKSLVERFEIKRALYPGSFVHISPSFVIQSVTYVDTDHRCPHFFTDPDILRMVKRRKRYPGTPEIVFHASNYTKPLKEEDESFDLLISQWTGPISQECLRYLKVGGLLVANASHGDVELASQNPAYQKVVVLPWRMGKLRLKEKERAAHVFRRVQ